MPRSLAPWSAFPVLWALSCGSVSSDELYTASASRTPSNGGSSATGGSSPTGGSVSSNGGSSTGAISGSGGAGPSTGGLFGSGGGGASSGGDPGTGGDPSSGGITGAGGGSPDMATPGVIMCAGTPCTIEAEPNNACCLGFGLIPAQCLPVFPGCGLGLGGNGQPLYCDDASDCGGGQVCCVSQTSEGTTSRCEPSCSGTGSGQQLCRNDAECSDGLKCSTWTRRPDYRICQ